MINFISQPMHKSLTRVKKYLEKKDNLESTHHHSASQCREEGSNSIPTLPELLCENQDLRQQIARLKKQARDDKSPRLCEKLSQTCYEAELQLQQLGLSQRRTPRSLSLTHRELPYQHRSFSRSREVFEQTDLQIIKRLENKVSYLTNKLQAHQEEKKELVGYIDTLAKKLEQSTLAVQKLSSLESSKHIRQSTSQEKYQSSKIRQVKTQEPKISLTTLQHQQQQSKLWASLMMLKEENYKLREQVASLAITNSCLKNQILKSSVPVEHLWRIKQVEIENMRTLLISQK